MKQWLCVTLLCLVAGLLPGCPIGGNGGSSKIADQWRVPVESEGDYDATENPIFGLYKGKYHLGEDWNKKDYNDFGKPVLSPAYGLVYKIDLGSHQDWGQVLQLKHPMPDGSVVYSVYAHLETIDQKILEGKEEIHQGDPIGTIGDADGEYSPHLHFEIRRTPWVLGDYLGWGYLSRVTPAEVQHLRSPSLFIKMRQRVDEIALSRNSYKNFRTGVMTGDSLISFEYQGQFAGWYQAWEDGWVDLPEINESGWHSVPFIFHPDYQYRIKAKKSEVKMHLCQPDWDHPAVKRDAALADFIALGLFPESYITEVFPDTLNLHDQPAGAEPGEWQSIEVATDYGRFKLYRGYDPTAPLWRVLFFEPDSGLGITANFGGTSDY